MAVPVQVPATSASVSPGIAVAGSSAGGVSAVPHATSNGSTMKSLRIVTFPELKDDVRTIGP
jgi:hypothetical protein